MWMSIVSLVVSGGGRLAAGGLQALDRLHATRPGLMSIGLLTVILVILFLISSSVTCLRWR